MTDYQEWAKFNVDKALAITDSTNEAEDIRAEQVRFVRDKAKETTELQEQARKAAAALRSKVSRLHSNLNLINHKVICSLP
jgi:galactokinase/mevalonate kinase-like predicted kinase